MMIGLIITGRKKDEEATEKKEGVNNTTTLANLVNENAADNSPEKDEGITDL
jgi:hypothetical protein